MATYANSSSGESFFVVFVKDEGEYTNDELIL